MKRSSELESAGVRGPIFISIGDQEKLARFVTVNPSIPPNSMFVDSYEFAAYKSVGLKSFTEVDKDAIKGVNLSAPQLGWKGLWKYIANVGKLAPVKQGQTGFPEGVLRLGATFVVSKNDVVYQWNDRVPGDHPEISVVVSQATKAASKKGLFAFL